MVCVHAAASLVQDFSTGESTDGPFPPVARQTKAGKQRIFNKISYTFPSCPYLP
jgi:hypothetical protein